MIKNLIQRFRGRIDARRRFAERCNEILVGFGLDRRIAPGSVVSTPIALGSIGPSLTHDALQPVGPEQGSLVKFDPEKFHVASSNEARTVIDVGYKAMPIKTIVFDLAQGNAREIETIRIVKDNDQPLGS